MSLLTNVGYTDTPIVGNPVNTLPRGNVNFGSDFRVKSNATGEIVLTNITSPIDRPEKVRIAFSDVSNIYTGTDIDPSVYAPSKRGFSLLAQVTDIFSVTDSVDPLLRIDLPCSVHLVAKGPASGYVTAAMLITMISRLLSVLFETGVASTDLSRLNALMRGSLTPKDI